MKRIIISLKHTLLLELLIFNTYKLEQMKKVWPLALVPIGLLLNMYGKREDVGNDLLFKYAGYSLVAAGIFLFLASRIIATKKAKKL